ncbi:hypothetical protein LAZ67_10001131 [Cordylochernes scorpioides]|uniref:Uncharacterized protein n=1 Tax=Cordylochernes scorpioides TaxID=51811 RepID=A0ABY6KX90_9ARAC|nr:hypothetical protein LAZ67_10001131 [Cordylochernes scorpioides]
MLRSGLVQERLAGYIRDMEYAVSKLGDMISWERWMGIKEGCSPRLDLFTSLAPLLLMTVTSPELKDTSWRRWNPRRDDDGRVIEGPELRRKAHVIFWPRFALATRDLAAGSAFTEGTTSPSYWRRTKHSTGQISPHLSPGAGVPDVRRPWEVPLLEHSPDHRCRRGGYCWGPATGHRLRRPRVRLLMLSLSFSPAFVGWILIRLATRPLLRRLESILGVGNVIYYAYDIIFPVYRDEQFAKVATVFGGLPSSLWDRHELREERGFLVRRLARTRCLLVELFDPAPASSAAENLRRNLENPESKPPNDLHDSDAGYPHHRQLSVPPPTEPPGGIPLGSMCTSSREGDGSRMTSVGYKNIANLPLIDSENIYSPPLHIKLGLMKNFVKAMDRNASGFAYLKQKFSSISEAKIKEGIFVGPQIQELQQDGNFQNSLNEVEAAAWNSFRNVCKNFLGSVKFENY